MTDTYLEIFIDFVIFYYFYQAFNDEIIFFLFWNEKYIRRILIKKIPMIIILWVNNVIRYTLSIHAKYRPHNSRVTTLTFCSFKREKIESKMIFDTKIVGKLYPPINCFNLYYNIPSFSCISTSTWYWYFVIGLLLVVILTCVMATDVDQFKNDPSNPQLVPIDTRMETLGEAYNIDHRGKSAASCSYSCEVHIGVILTAVWVMHRAIVCTR